MERNDTDRTNPAAGKAANGIDMFEDSYEDPDMDEFLSQVAERFCPNCGEKIERNPRGRPKVFCNETCRLQFWNRHPRPDAWGCYESRVCPVCGKVFRAKRRRSGMQKYCSIACSNRARGKVFRRITAQEEKRQNG